MHRHRNDRVLRAFHGQAIVSSNVEAHDGNGLQLCMYRQLSTKKKCGPIRPILIRLGLCIKSFCYRARWFYDGLRVECGQKSLRVGHWWDSSQMDRKRIGKWLPVGCSTGHTNIYLQNSQKSHWIYVRKRNKDTWKNIQRNQRQQLKGIERHSSVQLCTVLRVKHSSDFKYA